MMSDSSLLDLLSCAPSSPVSLFEDTNNSNTLVQSQQPQQTIFSQFKTSFVDNNASSISDAQTNVQQYPQFNIEDLAELPFLEEEEAQSCEEKFKEKEPAVVMQTQVNTHSFSGAYEVTNEFSSSPDIIEAFSIDPTPAELPAAQVATQVALQEAVENWSYIRPADKDKRIQFEPLTSTDWKEMFGNKLQYLVLRCFRTVEEKTNVEVALVTADKNTTVEGALIMQEPNSSDNSRITDNSRQKMVKFFFKKGVHSFGNENRMFRLKITSGCTVEYSLPFKITARKTEASFDYWVSKYCPEGKTNRKRSRGKDHEHEAEIESMQYHLQKKTKGTAPIPFNFFQHAPNPEFAGLFQMLQSVPQNSFLPKNRKVLGNKLLM